MIQQLAATSSTSDVQLTAVYRLHKNSITCFSALGLLEDCLFLLFMFFVLFLFLFFSRLNSALEKKKCTQQVNGS